MALLEMKLPAQRPAERRIVRMSVSVRLVVQLEMKLPAQRPAERRIVRMSVSVRLVVQLEMKQKNEMRPA